MTGIVLVLDPSTIMQEQPDVILLLLLFCLVIMIIIIIIMIIILFTGIVEWPESVAPYSSYSVRLNQRSLNSSQTSQKTGPNPRRARPFDGMS